MTWEEKYVDCPEQSKYVIFTNNLHMLEIVHVPSGSYSCVFRTSLLPMQWPRLWRLRHALHGLAFNRRWPPLFLAEWHAALAREMPCRSPCRPHSQLPMQWPPTRNPSTNLTVACYSSWLVSLPHLLSHTIAFTYICSLYASVTTWLVLFRLMYICFIWVR